MNEITRNTSTNIQQDIAKLDNVYAPASAAIAAHQAAKEEQAETRHSRHGKHHHKTEQEMTLDERKDLIEFGNGVSATGFATKSNKVLTQRPKAPNGADVEDAWEDPYEVEKSDGVQDALAKLAQRAEEALLAERVSEEDLQVDLSEENGLNDVSQNIREFGNYGPFQGRPELYLVLGGLSETLDSLVIGSDPANRNDLVTDQNVIDLFMMLSKRRREAMTELEREAELMLGGAVAILAIPQIIEKLKALGVDAKVAESLKGPLAQIISEAKERTSDLNSMYLMLAEECEMSKRDAEVA